MTEYQEVRVKSLELALQFRIPDHDGKLMPLAEAEMLTLAEKMNNFISGYHYE